MYDISTTDRDYISIILTHECDMNCVFCSDKYRGTKGYISMENVIRALEFAKDIKVKDISIFGGEAALHPNIINVAKKIKSYGFNLIMTTNYSRPEVIKSLDGIVDSFNISYYNQKTLPSQSEFKSDLTLATLLWQERFPKLSDLDKFIDKFEKEYYLKFSTLNSANEWCMKRKKVDYLDDLPNAKKIYTFEFYPAQLYRGHVIMRADLPYIENDVKAWKMFPDGRLDDKW